MERIVSRYCTRGLVLRGAESDRSIKGWSALPIIICFSQKGVCGWYPHHSSNQSFDCCHFIQRTPASSSIGSSAIPARRLLPSCRLVRRTRFACFPMPLTLEKPLTSHGFKDATTAPEMIRKWWSRWPDANVAIPTGRVSGLLVLDVDPRNGGDENWKALITSNPPLPITAKQRSGGGGLHICFRYPATQAKTGALDRGVEIASDGHYILVAPSIHPSGNAYAWAEERGPEALMSLLTFPLGCLSASHVRGGKTSMEMSTQAETTPNGAPASATRGLHL